MEEDRSVTFTILRVNVETNGLLSIDIVSTREIVLASILFDQWLDGGESEQTEREKTSRLPKEELLRLDRTDLRGIRHTSAPDDQSACPTGSHFPLD